MVPEVGEGDFLVKVGSYWNLVGYIYIYTVYDIYIYIGLSPLPVTVTTRIMNHF